MQQQKGGLSVNDISSNRQHLIDRSSPVPTYQQIASDISKRIAQHEWYIDEKLPSEMELAKIYGVSRVTLRQAMAQLEKDGSSKNSRARVHLSRAIRGVSCRTWHSPPWTGTIQPLTLCSAESSTRRRPLRRTWRCAASWECGRTRR